VHIATREPGGKSVVVDSKNFNGDLPTSEAQDVENYRKGGRDSAAIIATGKNTTIPPATEQFMEDHEMGHVPENRNMASNIQKQVADATDKVYVQGHMRDETYVRPTIRNAASQGEK
jgi:hypothetical protein